MKTPYILVLALSLSVLGTACSKNKKPSSQSVGASVSVANDGIVEDAKTLVVDGLVVNKDFVASADDKVVEINSTIAGPLGIVRLEGDEAQKLYEALAVEESMLPENETTEAAIARIGKDIECYSQTNKQTKKTKYDCNYYFDYKTGESKQRNATVRIVRDTESSAEDFHGKTLVLFRIDGSGYINITDAGAKMIYDGLTEQEKILSNGTKIKFGENINCKNIAENYSCHLYLDYRIGEVKSTR